MSGKGKEDPGSRKPATGGSKRSERGPSTNLFWFLMIALIVGIVAFGFSNSWRPETLTFSDFKSKIESGALGPHNVHELTIGLKGMTFQNAPKSTAANKTTPKQYAVSVVGMQGENEARLTELLDQSKISYKYEEAQSPWRDILFLSLFTLLCLGILFVALRRMGGPGSAIAFSRSRGKLYVQEDLGITFNDVAGIDEAVEELREIVEFLRNPSKYQALGRHGAGHAGTGCPQRRECDAQPDRRHSCQSGRRGL